jgi:hypothetical protein
MDVNFTPNDSLGRMLYTFTATAYEMDECTLENFENYGIQTIGTYSTNLEYSYTKIGQLIRDFSAKEDAFTLIAQKYKDMTLSKYINTLNNISWLRIEFNSDPYLIKTVAGVPMPLAASDKADENTAYGYIVYINNKPIIVSPRRFYELIDEDTEVTSVYFPVATSATIDYMAELIQTENTSLLYNKMYFNTKVGQIHSLFEVDESVFKDIYLKYLFDYTTYHQSLMSLDEVTIEAEPGTVVYIKDSFDEDYFKHEFGPTGVLKFHDDDAVLVGFYFAGMRLYKNNKIEPLVKVSFNETITVEPTEVGKTIDTEKLTEIKENIINVDDTQTQMILDTYYFKADGCKLIVKTKDTDNGEYSSVKDNEYVETNESTRPLKNGVYLVNGVKYIYYHDEWYQFTDDEVVRCPVEGLVDYVYEVMKGEY